MAEWEAKRAPGQRFDVIRYGLLGTPTTFALEEAVAAIEGGYRAMLMSSGLAAVTAPLQACLKCGDHVLMVDLVYGPARNFCEKVLTRCGVATTYYDPLIGEGIAKLMRPNTKVVYTELPGSLTFEVQDIPAIAGRARRRRQGADGQYLGLALAVPVLRPRRRRVDPCRDQIHRRPFRCDARRRHHHRGDDLPVRTMAADLGHCAGPDDAYYALRGLRTLSVRLERHRRTARSGALAADPARSVARALSGPARRSGPCLVEARFPRRQRPVWRGAAAGGQGSRLCADRHARPVGIGASWGGFESLIQPTTPARIRSATRWTPEGPTLRLHIGLEDPQDLIEDLETGFHALCKTAA